MIGKNGDEMVREFLRMSQGSANCYHVTESKPHSPMLDVLAVSDASPVLGKHLSRLAPDGYLVVNSDDKAIFSYLPKGVRLITYGFNNKACITASSVADDRLHICIQRAFTALDGDVRDPQEFSAQSGMVPLSPEATLGAAAVWAICSNKKVNVSA